ncbi:MAG: methionyl-tRNA formyltransferase [Candidatus Omnitrophica bacterium]|nr:methionyl-tRNA formyltransferase [Candidatus Omnitrophota bacterium]
MKIIFFGTDDFAAKHLESLLSSSHQILACITQPDRPKGRGMKMISPPVKTIAERRKIPVFQPADFCDQEFLQKLRDFQADLFVVIAYGKILSATILQIPKVYSINVHASLLPQYRGAAPINWVIINGEKETGISIIKMNPKMDAGEIVAQKKIKIAEEATAVTLRAQLVELGTSCLLETIEAIAQGKTKLTPQDESKVTFAAKLTKELGLIPWQKSAIEIHNLVRGLLPWPAAYTFFQGKMLKILETSWDSSVPFDSPVGTIVEIEKERVAVATGRAALWIKKVQPESGKPMDVRSFQAGHALQVGNQFMES